MFTKGADDAVRCGHPCVRQNQDVGQFLVEIIVNDLRIGHQVIHFGGEIAPGFGQAFLQTLKKSHNFLPWLCNLARVLLQIDRYHA